jgi:NAD(P)-dependent dehydrogenase (short-subunit alcohol dehydrogenase family)
MIDRKVCIVTGATSGIGKLAAFRLAEVGATVVLVSRNGEKGKQVIEEIVKKTGNQNLDLLIADLSAQSAIRQAAADFLSKYKNLDVLINNAGLAGPRRLTTDGIEMTFAVNHLAYFLLTNLLLDRLQASAPARIINVSSEAHRRVQLDFENLQGEKHYSGFKAYSLTKLCNILFTTELARRLQGTKVTANAVHPGYLRTGIFREAPGFVQILVKLTAGNPEKGAQAIAQLATSPDFENVTGKYFNGKKESMPSPTAQDRESASRLWEISASLTGFPSF